MDLHTIINTLRFTTISHLLTSAHLLADIPFFFLTLAEVFFMPFVFWLLVKGIFDDSIKSQRLL